MPYIVMDTDRHSDPRAYICHRLGKAIELAQSIVDAAPHADAVPEAEREVSPDTLRDAGWLFYRCYSVEGDSVWVYATDFEDEE